MTNSQPRIAFIDIETSPILGYSWAMFDTNILSVKEPIKVLSFAWKWLGDKETNIKALCDYKSYVPRVVDDQELVEDIWAVLDEADVIIAHNGSSFDCKIINARFIANNLKAPSDYKQVDTLKAAKKYFRFISNSLNELGMYLGEGQKAATGGFSTWLDCMAGDMKAWDRMKKYNVQDIELLERVYLRLRPFIGDHPNLNLISPVKVKTSEHACTTCQSLLTTKRGLAITKAGRYQRYSCNNCGSWSSGPYERNKINHKEWVKEEILDEL